jgi:Bifunctional DNA primase/polymerase, N-terminal
MVHTSSGGLHVYFDAGNRELRCSAGLIGPGLDIRATGGYVIVSSPGSGYTWDPVHNFKTTALAPAPDWLWPPIPSRSILPPPPAPAAGLSPYGKAAIEGACTAIVRSPGGEQERTLNAECFSIGTAAAAGLLPADLALRELLRAGNAMPDHETRWPWRAEEIDLKVRRAFAAGLQHPREARRAVAA